MQKSEKLIRAMKYELVKKFVRLQGAAQAKKLFIGSADRERAALYLRVLAIVLRLTFWRPNDRNVAKGISDFLKSDYYKEAMQAEKQKNATREF